MASLTQAEAQRLREMLLDVVHTVGRWLVRPIWEPAPGATAATDIHTTSGLPAASASLWGQGPIRTTFVVARLMCQATLDYAGGVANLVSASTQSALPADALARSALEAASQAWWLLDPDIDGRTRVVRCFLLRHGDATELANTVDKLNMVDPISDYGRTTDEVARYYVTQLGLPEITGRGNFRDLFRCDGQKLLTRSGFVEEFMSGILDANEQDQAKGAYAYFCGASHAQLWRLMQAVEPVKGPDGSSLLASQIAAEPVRAAIGNIIHACLEPAMRAVVLFGWNGEYYSQCDDLVARIDSAMGLSP